MNSCANVCRWMIPALVGLAGFGNQAAQAVVVNALLPEPVTTTLEWYATPITGTTPGVAAIEDLTGKGGDLENNNPVGIGAARLTTGGDTGDRAGASIYDDGLGTVFGNAATALGNIDLSYDYHKLFVAGGNAAAAPSLKIDLFSPTGSGSGDFDSYGTLIWEAANQGVGNPLTDLWQSVVLDENSGGGDGDSVGGWWWSGGFGIGSGFGGAPFRSLAEWVTAFQTGPDSADFAGANVLGFSIGLGSFNLNTDGYFDNVSISINDGSIAYSETFDFDPIPLPAVPEPSTLCLLVPGLFALLRTAHRRGGRSDW